MSYLPMRVLLIYIGLIFVIHIPMIVSDIHMMSSWLPMSVQLMYEYTHTKHTLNLNPKPTVTPKP